MEVKAILILFLITLALPSCSENPWDIRRYHNKFEAHKEEFEALVSLLKLQRIKVGYPINENDLPKSIHGILVNLNISDININVSSCKDTPTYEFTTSWSGNATLYFSKDSCNKAQTIKGYHEKVSETIELWGMGDEWTMWIDYDFK
jgi:hypothetical protein